MYLCVCFDPSEMHPIHSTVTHFQYSVFLFLLHHNSSPFLGTHGPILFNNVQALLFHYISLRLVSDVSLLVIR